MVVVDYHFQSLTKIQLKYLLNDLYNGTIIISVSATVCRRPEVKFSDVTTSTSDLRLIVAQTIMVMTLLYRSFHKNCNGILIETNRY